MSNCSTGRNDAYQPPSLLKSAFLSMAERQMKHFLVKEPFVAYSKLNDSTLEIFGTAFGNEISNRKIEFLHELTSNFRIQKVIFRWFYFDEKMLKIFDIFGKKLQGSVKWIAFEKCYFPAVLILDNSIKLPNVTTCFFMHCFANEAALKKMFKIFENAPVKSLEISMSYSYAQDVSINSNDSLKMLCNWKRKQNILKLSELELNSFFPSLQFLSLSYCKFDFDYFDLKSARSLSFVNIFFVSFENFSSDMLLNKFPPSVKNIQIDTKDYFSQLNFMMNAFGANITINNSQPFEYSTVNCVTALSVFSFLQFDLNLLNNEMTAISKHVKNNGNVFDGVTSIIVKMTVDLQNITNLTQLLSYFPNLSDLSVMIHGSIDPSLDNNIGKICGLFSTISMRNIKNLSIRFDQTNESPAFYCFIIELMKLCKEMSALEFIYFKVSNLFAINIKDLIGRDNIQFPNLDTFSVKYFGSVVNDMSIDLFYISRYKIKRFTMNIPNLVENLVALEQIENFSVGIFKICTSSVHEGNLDFIKRLLVKFPYVLNFDCYNPLLLLSVEIHKVMKILKNVTVGGVFSKNTFRYFLTVLPASLESLNAICNSGDMEEIQMNFYERFPTAALMLNLT